MDKEITIREALVLVDRLIKMRERLQEQIKERNCYIAKPENSKKINALIGKYTMLILFMNGKELFPLVILVISVIVGFLAGGFLCGILALAFCLYSFGYIGGDKP